MKCDGFENTARVAKHIVVPETQHSVALLFKECAALPVVIGGKRMLAAVNLDDQFLGEAGKVREIRSDGHLTAPLHCRQLGSQRSPELALRIRGIAAEIAGSRDGAGTGGVIRQHDLTLPQRCCGPLPLPRERAIN